MTNNKENWRSNETHTRNKRQDFRRYCYFYYIIIASSVCVYCKGRAAKRAFLIVLKKAGQKAQEQVHGMTITKSLTREMIGHRTTLVGKAFHHDIIPLMNGMLVQWEICQIWHQPMLCFRYWKYNKLPRKL